MKQSRHGFTLVELSIVLVIVGILVGGVLAGKSMLHASELRSVTTDYMRYVTAANRFHDDYSAVAGDLSTATTYWPACIDDPTLTSSCNGNGNNIIDNAEQLRFWQHLTLAGILEGTYTGMVAGNGATTDYLSPGINVPKSKINNAVWAVRDASVIGLSGNVFLFGGLDSDDIGDMQPNEAIITPDDAWNLDKKMDDADPSVGSIIGTNGIDVGHCLSGSAPNIIYDRSFSGIGCRLVLKLD